MHATAIQTECLTAWKGDWAWTRISSVRTSPRRTIRVVVGQTWTAVDGTWTTTGSHTRSAIPGREARPTRKIGRAPENSAPTAFDGATPGRSSARMGNAPLLPRRRIDLQLFLPRCGRLGSSLLHVRALHLLRLTHLPTASFSGGTGASQAVYVGRGTSPTMRSPTRARTMSALRLRTRSRVRRLMAGCSVWACPLSRGAKDRST